MDESLEFHARVSFITSYKKFLLSEAFNGHVTCWREGDCCQCILTRTSLSQITHLLEIKLEQDVSCVSRWISADWGAATSLLTWELLSLVLIIELWRGLACRHLWF